MILKWQKEGWKKKFELYASLIMVCGWQKFADRISPHFWNFANSLQGIIFQCERRNSIVNFKEGDDKILKIVSCIGAWLKFLKVCCENGHKVSFCLLFILLRKLSLLGKKWAHIVRKLHFLPLFYFILIESEEIFLKKGWRWKRKSC